MKRADASDPLRPLIPVACGCQMTMGSYDEGYFECGKPAKFTYVDRVRGVRRVCGIHGRPIEKRQPGSLTPIK